jgi:hypothetical protein
MMATVAILFTFDPAKDEANRRAHGLPLAIGAVVIESALGEVAGCSPASTRCAARCTASSACTR